MSDRNSTISNISYIALSFHTFQQKTKYVKMCAFFHTNENLKTLKTSFSDKTTLKTRIFPQWRFKLCYSAVSEEKLRIWDD